MGREDRAFFAREIKPGMTVVDVGANIGLYALNFSQLVGPSGQVYAFEPAPDLFKALEAGRKSSGRSNLQVFPYGLGARTETLQLQRSFFNSGDNRIGASGGDFAGDSTAVEIRRGDELLADAPHVDFIKIDVQGWELHALRGLTETIRRSPEMQIYLEFWPQGLRAAGASPAELWSFLCSHGFNMRREVGGKWVPVATVGEVTDSMAEDAYINLWARRE